MAICSNENCKKIIIGGFKDKDFSFCNTLCHKEGYLAIVSDIISLEQVMKEAKIIHESECPKCNIRKPVDVHTSYRIFSLLLYSGRWSIPNISCRGCGIRSQVVDSLFSLIFGWWGHLGIIYTPAFLFSNFIELIKGVDPSKPSLKLEHFIKNRIATELYNSRIT